MGSSSSQRGEKSLVVVPQQAWDRLVYIEFCRHFIAAQRSCPFLGTLSGEPCQYIQRNQHTIKDIDILIKREENERLCCAAMPHMKQLYEAIKGKGYVVILTDPLEESFWILFGDKRMQSLAESLNVVPRFGQLGKGHRHHCSRHFPCAGDTHSNPCT